MSDDFLWNMYIYEYRLRKPFIRLQLGRGILSSLHSNYSDIHICIVYRVTPVNSAFYTFISILLSYHIALQGNYLYLSCMTYNVAAICAVIITERVKKDSKCIKQ